MDPSRGDRGPDFVQSLARGLEVLTAFSSTHPTLTLSEAARRTGLSRPAARRVLLTLRDLGYVRSDGRDFALTPKVLNIGYSYLSSLDVGTVAQSEMEALAETTRESCSVAVLDGPEIVYVARVPTKRIMAISLNLGSRLPAWATSMGRVLLADLPHDERSAILDESSLQPRTPHTVTDRARLDAELERVGAQGWAIVDQELEEAVRSVAVPLRDATGRAVAAMNLGTNAMRISIEDVHGWLLPALLAAAERINARLSMR